MILDNAECAQTVRAGSSRVGWWVTYALENRRSQQPGVNRTPGVRV